LTSIQCAVVEGGHRCEAACQVLQGYHLGDHIPLEQKGVNVPPESTLFQESPTAVYYYQDKDKQLDRTVLDELKAIIEKIAQQKTLVVHITWHDFFKQVTDEMSKHLGLDMLLYDKAEEFYAEYATYRQYASKELPSNKCKKYIHEILTNALFTCSPSKELILALPERYKPSRAKWAGTKNKGLSLSAEPYQHVSKYES
jgi:hypothetical protein